MLRRFWLRTTQIRTGPGAPPCLGDGDTDSKPVPADLLAPAQGSPSPAGGGEGGVGKGPGGQAPVPLTQDPGEKAALAGRHGVAGDDLACSRALGASRFSRLPEMPCPRPLGLPTPPQVHQGSPRSCPGPRDVVFYLLKGITGQ